MADISMCTNKECPSKEDCWRFQASPSEWQSYVGHIFDPATGKCSSFYPMNDALRRNKWGTL